MSEFAGRSIFITGAGSGVGRATVAHFATAGANVFGVDVNESGLAETIQSVRAAGGTADGTGCDVSDRASVDAAVAAAVAAHGGVDVLVNVAGIGGFLRFEEVDAAEWARTLGVNLTGPFNTIQAALPHLLRSTSKAIVNVASTAGLRGTAYAIPYASSKFGLVGLSRSLALELASRDVRVNCVCPGGIRTPLGRFFQRREDFDQNVIDYSAPPKPGNFADPEDIARVIAFLASDAARMVNGAVLTADGGTLA